MSDPRYSADDYAGALRQLLPRGRVWNNDPASVQGELIAAVGAQFARVDATGSELLELARPGDNLDLLEEWEETLGLPDPCAGSSPTVDQRAAAVRARFMSGGGQSRDRYIAFAAALGFTITITNFQPFRVGRSTVGNPLASDAWTFVWGVTVTANTSGLADSVLICELNAIKPAETTIILL